MRNRIAAFSAEQAPHGATIDVVDPQGNEIHAETTAKFDGKDYPIKGSPIAEAVSVKRANEREADIVLKKGGKVVMTEKSRISAVLGLSTTSLKTSAPPAVPLE